jgi:hypothetical protein
MYWVVGFLVRRANLDGSQVEDFSAAIQARYMTIDRRHQKIYWIRSVGGTNGQIFYANLDGSQVEAVTDTLNYIGPGLAVDSQGRKLYWYRGPTSSAPRIQRANLDGSDLETLALSRTPHQYFALNTPDPLMIRATGESFVETQPVMLVR